MTTFEEALRLNQAGRGQEALPLFERAARDGHPQAALIYASALAHGQFIAANPEAAFAFLKAQAPDDLTARRARASAMLAGFGLQPDWQGGIKLLAENADRGDIAARRSLALIAALLGERKQAQAITRQTSETLADQDELLAALTPESFWSGHEFDRHNQAPAIKSSGKVFADVITDTLVSLAAPQIRPAQIIDPTTGQYRMDPYRQAGAMTFLPFNQDPLVSALDRLLCDLAGVPLENGEQIGVLSYTPGQEYRPHYDCFVEAHGADKSELARGGQRIRTVLLILTDTYEGGATSFPSLGISVRPGKGSLIVFDNVDDKGEADKRSLHAGEPVTSGMKWIATKWIRANPYQRVG